MVPMSSSEEEKDKAAEGSRKATDKKAPQNPAVLRAALEIVKRKKQDAVEKEEYETAAKFHQKMQELESHLASLDASEATAASTSGAGEKEGGAAAGADALTAQGDDKEAAAPRKRSLFAAPNPFRTVELLRQSGYSRLQAIALLGLLYVAVFGLEILLLYVGWSVWGRTSTGGEDGGEETYDEF